MKRGRPRKPEDSAGITGAHYQRIREASNAPILESTFGRLAFQKEFTEYQIDTREKVLQIYRDCRAHMGVSSSAASPSFEIGAIRSPVFEDDEARERAEATLKAFDRITDVLSRFRRDTRRAFHELCIEERYCPPDQLSRVKVVLDALAASFSMKAQARKKKA